LLQEMHEGPAVRELVHQRQREVQAAAGLRMLKRDTKLKSFIAAHLALLGLGACAVSTGILPAGPDTYTVTERRSPVLGGSVEAQKVATLEANDYCAKQGRVFQPMNFQTLTAMSGTGM
jgi:hypothetical protein